MTDIKQLLPTNIYQGLINATGVPTAANPFVTISQIAAITTMNTARLLGRYSVGSGVVEEITIGANLSLSVGGVLSATGGGGGITSLNTLVAAAQTFVDDTNISIVSAGSTHTLTWLSTLSIARGGTNSGTALNNNRVMISSGGAIIEHTAMPAAGTQGAVWYANASGLPNSNSFFTVATATNNVRIGASGTSSEKLSIVGAGTNTGLGIIGAGIAAVFSTSSTTLASTELNNSSGLVTPVSMFNLKNTNNVPTIGSGIYQSFYDQIAGPSTEITGQFGVITTSIAAGTFKSAFVWNTPNETTGTLVERMRLTSAGVLTLKNLVATGNVYNTNTPNIANSNTVVSTVAETNFTGTGITLVIPANTLAIGDRIKVKVFGIYSGVLAQTLNLRFKTGVTTLLATGARVHQTASTTNVGFTIDVILTVRTIGAGGTISCDMISLFDETPFVDGSVIPSNGTKAFNTTVANTLQFSAQWGTSSASNSITIENIDWQILKN